jgi:Cys-rich repeat protein
VASASLEDEEESMAYDHSPEKRATILVGLALLIGAAGITPLACGGTGDDAGVFGGGGGSSADCGGCPGSQVCDADFGCVQCNIDSACGNGFCIAGDCVECATSSDCAAGQSCWPADHECKPACSSDADCTGDNATHCDPVSKACVECVDSSTCGNQTCDPTFGTCVECTSDVDCPAGEAHCDASGECRECLTNAHCDVGQICSEHHCTVASCTSDGDCAGENPHCDPDSGKCFECVVDAHCADGDKAHCSPAHQCVKCLVDADCGDSGQVCEDFECKGG